MPNEIYAKKYYIDAESIESMGYIRYMLRGEKNQRVLDVMGNQDIVQCNEGKYSGREALNRQKVTIQYLQMLRINFDQQAAKKQSLQCQNLKELNSANNLIEQE